MVRVGRIELLDDRTFSITLEAEEVAGWEHAIAVQTIRSLELAGARWAQIEYENGVDTGRHGVVSTRVEKKRTTAMLKFRAAAARLREVVKRRPSG